MTLLHERFKNTVDSERVFGIEIEFYGVHKDTVITALREREGVAVYDAGYTHRNHDNEWKLVYDSTVPTQGTGQRGGGNELVSPKLQGLDGIKQLQAVCRVLNEYGAKVNRKCGLHLHLDAADLTLKNWKQIINLYHRYSPAIKEVLPESRHSNSMCTYFSERQLERMQDASSIEELLEIAGNRYRVINLEAFVRHGSIEFRQHSGTTEFEKIMNWVELHMSIIEYTKQAKRIINYKYDLSKHNATGLFYDLFTSYASKKAGMAENVVDYYKNRKKELKAQRRAV